MKWWLVKPENAREGRRCVSPMWISDEALAIKEPRWREDPDLEPWAKQEISSVALDGGGVMRIGAHRFSTPFFDSTLYIFATQVEGFIDTLRDIESRPSGLYNVVCWPCLLVLTKEQVLFAERWLHTIAAEAAAIAEVENEDFNRTFIHNPKPHVMLTPRPVRGKIEEA